MREIRIIEKYTDGKVIEAGLHPDNTPEQYLSNIMSIRRNPESVGSAYTDERYNVDHGKLQSIEFVFDKED